MQNKYQDQITNVDLLRRIETRTAVIWTIQPYFCAYKKLLTEPDDSTEIKKSTQSM